MKATVHNTDGVNPYATEVAALLARRGVQVSVVDARNGEHRPPAGVRWRRLLPANYGRASGPRQLLALLRGLLATVWSGLVRGHVVVVAWSRFPAEDLLLAALGRIRPVVVVAHNPVPRKAESRLARRARQALLRRARAVVVHAERLRGDVDPAAGDRVVVCPHPPYAHTGVAVPAGEVALAADRRWVAFVGMLRWDKGVDLLPELLARVPAAERRRLGLVVCGSGELPGETWDRFAELGLAVRDLTAPVPVPQETMLAVLSQQPLLLAPYVAATQSGSVILALSLGCRVLAFDEGGIPDVVHTDGLVPSGDLDAMAAAIAAGRGGGALLPVEEWAERTADAWLRAVAAAGGWPAQPSGIAR